MPEIQMPKLSDTMTEGTLVAWKKKKGDNVSAGEVLADIETDKATMEWESPEDWNACRDLCRRRRKVNVGDKIAFIGGEGEEAPKEEEKGKEEKSEVEKERKKRSPTKLRRKKKSPKRKSQKRSPRGKVSRRRKRKRKL